MPKASEPTVVEPDVCKPVPDRDTVFVPVAVGMLNVPDAPFITVGVKVTLYVQVAPAASDAPHVVELTENGPEMVGADTVDEVLPVLASVTACEAVVVPTVWLPKASDAGVAATTARRPVPDNDAVFVPAAVTTVRAPACEPIDVGAKATFTVQFAPAASEAGQLCVALN